MQVPTVFYGTGVYLTPDMHEAWFHSDGTVLLCKVVLGNAHWTTEKMKGTRHGADIVDCYKKSGLHSTQHDVHSVIAEPWDGYPDSRWEYVVFSIVLPINCLKPSIIDLTPNPKTTTWACRRIEHCRGHVKCINGS